jgi:hypothetical protein
MGWGKEKCKFTEELKSKYSCFCVSYRSYKTTDYTSVLFCYHILADGCFKTSSPWMPYLSITESVIDLYAIFCSLLKLFRTIISVNVLINSKWEMPSFPVMDIW